MLVGGCHLEECVPFAVIALAEGVVLMHAPILLVGVYYELLPKLLVCRPLLAQHSLPLAPVWWQIP